MCAIEVAEVRQVEGRQGGLQGARLTFQPQRQIEGIYAGQWRAVYPGPEWSRYPKGSYPKKIQAGPQRSDGIVGLAGQSIPRKFGPEVYLESVLPNGPASGEKD